MLVDERNELVRELLHWQTEEVEGHGERQRQGGSKDKVDDEYALSIHQAHHSGDWGGLFILELNNNLIEVM